MTTFTRNIFVTLLAVALSSISAHAAGTTTWVGNTDANWNTAANWTTSGGSTPPVNGDSLVFGAAGSAGTSLNNNLSGLTINKLTFNSGASSFTFGGNGLTLGNGGIDASALSSGTQTISVGITPAAGVQRWNVGAGATLALGSLPTQFGPAGGIVVFANTGTKTTTAGNGWDWRGGGPGLLGPGFVIDNGNNTYDWAASTGSSPYTIAAATYMAAGTGDKNNVLTTGNATVNSLNASWASIKVSGATLTLNGTQIYVDTGIILQNGGTIAGNAPLKSNSDGLYIYVPDTGTISSSLQNNGANAKKLYKAGPGTLTLSGGNSYTGNTVIYEGTLNFTYGSGANTTFSSGISGVGPVTLTASSGTPRVHFNAANTYSGATTIGAGVTLEINAVSSYSANSDYTVNGVMESYNNLASATIGALNGSGTIYNTGDAAGTTTFTVGANGNSGSFSGVIANGAWGSRVTALVKSGGGTQTLTGSSSYNGGTTINAGTLLVNNTSGSGTGSGAVGVNNANSTLGGVGTISGAVTMNAGTILSPGTNSTTGRTLTCSGGVTFSGGAKATFDLSSSAASGNDKVAVTGTLTIGTADTITINPITASTLDTADYTLFTAATVSGTGTPTLNWGSSTPANAANYSLVKNASSLVLHYTAPGAPPLVGITQFSPASPVIVGTTVTASASVSSSGTGLTYQWQSSPDGSTWSDIGGATSATYTVPTGSAGTTHYRLTATDSLGTGTGTGAALTVRTSASLTWLASPANALWNHSSINWSGGGGVFLDGDSVTFDSTGSGGTVTVTETVVPASLTFDHNNNYTLAASGGTISGTASLTKSGNGTLTVSGANSFSGGTMLNAGKIAVGHNGALGTGTITLAGGTLVNSGDITLTNAIQAFASTTTVLDNGTGNNLTLNGNITGSGTLTRGSSFTASVYIGGDNSGFTGTYQDQNSGNSVTRWTSPNAGSANARWIFNQAQVDSRTTPNFGTGTIHFGSISGGGFISQNSPGTATLQVGALGLNDTFSGSMRNGAGAIALTKVGTGTLTLSGANTYTGATTVSNGTLVVNGSLAAGSAVTVEGGTLGGSGTVGGAVTVNSGGTLAPGTSIGTLTLGSLTLNSGATAAMEIGDGPSGDKAPATGAVVYGGTLKLLWTGTTASTGTVDLFDGSSFSGSFSSLQVSNWPSAYRVNTNNLITDGSITIAANAAPVAQNLTMGVAQGDSATLNIIGGKKSPTDADGDALSVMAVALVTPANGGAVSVLGGTSVVYTASASFSGTDSFTYTVSDLFGATDTKTVTVTVSPAGTGANITGISGSSPTITVHGFGMPGATYQLQYTTNLSPVSWQDVSGAGASAAANPVTGVLTLTDAYATNSQSWYRTRFVSAP